ncbi:MAG: 4a-hydroxytetrahydrobiopterin dehydratase [Candidatus Riflebacteria bacterium]|nr:4a-hydroxytetrahydrobiopterin dehydratase [Candidatus Riflebacteria bacterium]
MVPEPSASEKCIPCRSDVPPLTPDAAGLLSRQVPRWELSADARRLARTFIFGDFVEAMKFVNRVAGVAEQQGHHPDIEIHYNRVKLNLWTHKINGLHANDFILAAHIDRLSP